MAATSALIVLDGAHGEGGGALLRTAFAMAALTQQPLRVNNVRGNTKYPGLDPEDLTILKALAQSCAAELVGAESGSSAVSFLPTRRPKGLNDEIEVVRSDSNRGPNALVVLNTLLPVLARSGTFCSVTTEGETYGHNALSYDAFANVTLLAMKCLGIYAYPNLLEGGFGRESAGKVQLEIEPSAIAPLHWPDRGRFESLYGVVATNGVPSSIGDRGVAHMKQLARSANLAMNAEAVLVPSAGPGVYVTVWARYERGIGSGAMMGSRGVRIESLVQSAFEETFDWMRSESTIDAYLADQILLPLVLAEGPSTFRVSRLTQRFLTTVWVIKQFLPIHITVRGSEGGPGLVTIQR